VLDQTAINAVPLRAPSKEALANPTAQLFKKQRLRLNPSFTEQQHAINVMNTHIVKDDASMNDDDISLSDHDSAHQSELLTEDIASVASEKSFDSEDTYGGNNVLAEDITESPVESDYSCFTTKNQKCVTSLMYLLDAMGCPDYGFKEIMEWARKCFEAGFDFNPKCKTRF